MTDFSERSDFFEQLTAKEHERWADWQKWMHAACIKNGDGSLTIPGGLVERWERQIATPYAELSEREQESDREQVRRYWPLIVERDAVVAKRIERILEALDAAIELIPLVRHGMGFSHPEYYQRERKIRLVRPDVKLEPH